ncbi:MAG: hypothetical protein WCO33_01105, partial [bacterium]
ISDEYKEIIQDFSDYIENYGINIQFKENDSLDGIKRSCKNAFRRFAFRYHPDTSPINDKARNQEIFKGVGNYYVEIDKMK